MYPCTLYGIVSQRIPVHFVCTAVLGMNGRVFFLFSRGEGKEQTFGHLSSLAYFAVLQLRILFRDEPAVRNRVTVTSWDGDILHMPQALIPLLFCDEVYLLCTWEGIRCSVK